MEIESEPDFLGTSIQFAEQQIKLLEQEYASQQVLCILCGHPRIEAMFVCSDAHYSGRGCSRID